MSSNDHEVHDEAVPPDVRGVSGLLDALGEAERGSAPAGLEARILARTPVVFEQPSVIARIGRMSWGLRAAATVALVGVLGLSTWLASQGGKSANQAPPAGTSGLTLLAEVNADMDEWASASSTSVDSDVAVLNNTLGTIESSGFDVSSTGEALEPSL